MIAKPSPQVNAKQPGTLGEQLIAVAISLWLADQRGTTAAEQWTEARRRARQHESRDEWRARR